MARASTRRELFLQVSGTVDPLKQNLKSGGAALIEFAGNAERQLEAVEQSLRSLGGGDTASTAKQLTANYTSAFREIRRNAEQVLSADSGAGALQILNANAARQAATAAENRAAAMRVVADAARAEAVAQGTANTELTQYAAAAIVAAKEAEDYAIALREQANTLSLVEGRLDAVVAPGERITRMTGQARAGMQQLSYQLGDVAQQIQANTPLSVIFAQQVGQVSQAIGLMTGESKGWVGSLGLWAPLAGVALVALTPLVKMMFEQGDALGDAVKKLKEEAEQTELTDRAHKAFAQTIEGQIDAQRRLNDELDKSVITQRQLQQMKVAEARTNLEAQRDSRVTLLGDIEKQKGRVAEFDRQIRNPGSLESAEIQALVLDAQSAQAELKRLQQQLATLNREIVNGERAVREAEVPLIQNDVAAAFDKRADAARRYEIQLGKLNQQFAIGEGKSEIRPVYQPDGSLRDERLSGIDRAQYERELRRITTARDKAIKDAGEAEKSAKRDHEFGRPVSSAEARRIAEGAGFQVNSADRSNARQKQLYDEWVAAGKPKDNPVAKPGSSAHEKGNALDIQIGPGVTVAAIREAFDKEGVRLTKVFKERGHYHVEWAKGGSGRAADPEREIDREANRKRAYEAQLDRAQEDYFRALGALADTTEDRGAVEFSRLRAATIQREKEIEQQVIAGKLTVTEAEKLRLLNQATYDLSKAGIARREEERLLDRKLDQDRAELSDKVSLLQLQGDLATTTRERRRIALLLLAAEEQERRDVANRKLQSANADVRSEGQRELDQLGRESPLRRARIERDSEGPLAKYRRELLETTADVNSAFEDVAVRGFGAMEEAGDREIANLLKLEGAVGDFVESAIADFARLALHQGFLQILGLLGLGGGGAGISIGSTSGVGLPSFGGARAAGGAVDPSNYYLVGEKGPELFIPGASGMILPNRLPSAPALMAPGAAGAAGGTTVIVHQKIEVPAGVDLATRTEVYRLAEATHAATLNAVAEANRRAA